jgi:hypothetical protein|tara:strand:- start:148 stop:633 length:486 start_codon:yes stop_codon:yes gene_type:complete
MSDNDKYANQGIYNEQYRDLEETLDIQKPVTPDVISGYKFSRALISAAFVMFILGSILGWAGSAENTPGSEDFNNSAEGYQKAIDDYNDRTDFFDDFSTLFLSTGVFILGAGLFFYSTEGSEHLPMWVRVALMAGTMLYLVRMATSDISTVDALTIFSIFN